MVVYCVSYGCKNLQDPRNPISFHTFPFKRPEILKKWVHVMRRENWQPSKHSRLCSDHFKESDYLVRPGCTVNLLKPDAVPSIFNFPKHLLQKEEKPRKVFERVDLPLVCNEVSHFEIENVETEIKAPRTKDVATQTHVDYVLRQRNLSRKIKTLQQTVRRKQMKIQTMNKLLTYYKKLGKFINSAT